MFVGRKAEMTTLNSLYHRNGFAMAVIYGRRRVGKSTLISEFIKEKKAIFYTATKVGANRNLELFTKEAFSVLDPSLKNVSFPTLDDALDSISRKLPEERMIMVVDEIPYWAEKDESLLSVFQKYIDTKWQNRNLMLIFCGSALSFMENKVLSEKSPVFGRRNAQIKLAPFTYKEAALFVPKYSYEEKAIVYGVTGGVAKYLSFFNPKTSLDENIKALFFNKDGYLYDETRNLLTQEFKDTTIVNNIIEQIASGENTLNKIAGKVGEKDQTVLYTIEKLIEIGLVEKKKCITEEKNKKKTQYVLKDTMFKFWYKYIPKATSVIEIGRGDIYYDSIVKPDLHSFMGSVFEDMCRYYVLEQGVQGRFGNLITECGSWWGVETYNDEDGQKRFQTADIDVVALSFPDKTALIGECKFKKEKIDKTVYDNLIRRGNLISRQYKITKYLFFSLNGYTEWFDHPQSDVALYLLDDLYL